jgi:hypothetical protein
VYYLRITIGSQVKHPVIEFDIFTLGYFTCLFHNLSNYRFIKFDSTGVKLYIFIHNDVRDFDKNLTQPEIRVNQIRDNESQL